MNAHSMPQRAPRIKVVTERLQRFVDSDNIAEELTTEQLQQIGGQVCSEYNIDAQSNSDWREMAEKALEVAMQAPEAKNYPFPGASNVKYPLVTVAALQFNARAYPAIVDGSNIVKAKITGSDKGIPAADPQTGQPQIQMDPQTGQPALDQNGQPQPVWQVEPGAKREKADRIAAHMSYQLGEEMEEWEEDTDTLLMQLPIVGTAFRKVYYDPTLGRNKSEMIAGPDLVVHAKTRSLETAPRITHKLTLYPSEIQDRQLAGLWLEAFDPGTATSDADGDEDAQHEFYEQHRLIDLDEDGYREPYIVTVHKDSQEVVRVVANYGLDDITMGATKVRRIERRDYFVKYGFIRDPKGGFYDIGFGALLESLGASIDTTINQLLDAGHLQNAGGGFIGSGLRLKKSTLTMEPGVYKTVDTTGTKIREAIYQMQHPGPSSVLFTLLGMLIDAAKDITAVQDIMTGDTKDANQTATTTLALIEQGMKVFTAIYKRIYLSLKREFKLLYRLNAEHLDDQTYFNVLDEEEAIARQDYQEGNYDVCPVADPRLVTDMQKLARAQLLLQFADDPYHDPMEVRRRYHMAAGQDDVDSLLRVPQPPQPSEMEVAGVQAQLNESDAKATKDRAQAAKAAAEAQFAGVDLQLEAAQIDQEERQFQARRADEAKEREKEKA